MRRVACQTSATHSQGMRWQRCTSVHITAWLALTAWPLSARICGQDIQVPGSGRLQLSCSSSALAAESAARVQAPLPEAVARHQSHITTAQAWDYAGKQDSCALRSCVLVYRYTPSRPLTMSASPCQDGPQAP